MSRPNSPPPAPRREQGTPSRWDHYRELLATKRIAQEARRWYAAHVERFLAAVKPTSLKALAADEITGYLG